MIWSVRVRLFQNFVKYKGKPRRKSILCRILRRFQIWPPFCHQRLHISAQPHSNIVSFRWSVSWTLAPIKNPLVFRATCTKIRIYIDLLLGSRFNLVIELASGNSGGVVIPINFQIGTQFWQNPWNYVKSSFTVSPCKQKRLRDAKKSFCVQLTNENMTKRMFSRKIWKSWNFQLLSSELRKKCGPNAQRITWGHCPF